MGKNVNFNFRISKHIKELETEPTKVKRQNGELEYNNNTLNYSNILTRVGYLEKDFVTKKKLLLKRTAENIWIEPQ